MKGRAVYSAIDKNTYTSLFVPKRMKWDPIRAKNLNAQETKNRGYNIITGTATQVSK